MEFSGFDWDDGNHEKCRKHGLTIQIIESLFQGPLAITPDPLHSAKEDRFKAIGLSAQGRLVLIAFTTRSRGEATLVRPISARYMHKKEIENYEKTVRS